jgi:hypothetical protein
VEKLLQIDTSVFTEEICRVLVKALPNQSTKINYLKYKDKLDIITKES